MDVAVMKEINSCLIDEWGAEDKEGVPSEDWPFKLEHWGHAEGWEIYRFDDNDGVDRYAGYAEGVGVISGSVAGMTLDDLVDEFRGGEWIQDQEPVDLNQVDDEEPGTVPGYDEGLDAVEDLVYDAYGDDAEFWILRGYYLKATKKYLAIVQRTRAKGETTVVGTGLDPISIGFRKASPERRLAIAVARNILNGGG